MLTRLFAVAIISALVFVPAGARATTTKDKVAQARSEVDAIAQRWFAAQDHAAQLRAHIADIERAMLDAQARVAATRTIATARAVMLYKTSNVALSPILGDNPLDSARRAELANQANVDSEDVIGQLTAAVQDLQSQRADLEREQAQQDKALKQVAQQRDALDAQLATLRAQAQREAEAAFAGARTRAARAEAQARLRAFVSPAVRSDLAAAPSQAPTAIPIAPPAANSVSDVAAPASGGGGSAHHNDPFLVCTRTRESGGIYSINTGNGYYGAYQFLPATWDSVAVHVGRMGLVGVLPSAAAPSDQDEIAWALYQWQGKSPWGGRC